MVKEKSAKGYEFGDKLVAIGVDGLSWVSKGDCLSFIRNSKNYDKDKGIWVTAQDGTQHCISEVRVARYGNTQAIAQAKAKSPKLHIVLGEGSRRVISDRVSLKIEDAEKLAKENLEDETALVIYALTPIKRLAKEVIETSA